MSKARKRKYTFSESQNALAPPVEFRDVAVSVGMYGNGEANLPPQHLNVSYKTHESRAPA